MNSTTIGSNPSPNRDMLSFLDFNPQVKKDVKDFLVDYHSTQHFINDPKFDNRYATAHLNSIDEAANKDIGIFVGNIKSTIEANKNLPPSEVAKVALENLRNRFLPKADFQKMLSSRITTLTEDINSYVAQIHTQYNGASSKTIDSIRFLIQHKKGLLAECLKTVR